MINHEFNITLIIQILMYVIEKFISICSIFNIQLSSDRPNSVNSHDNLIMIASIVHLVGVYIYGTSRK